MEYINIDFIRWLVFILIAYFFNMQSLIILNLDQPSSVNLHFVKIFFIIYN